MIIDRLPSLPSTPANGDELPIERGTTAYKTDYNALATAIGSPMQSGLAIIVDGDTASQAVPAGGYAYIRNNQHGLAEGLYTNKTSSPYPASGGTANSTVFAAVGNGGLNSVMDKIGASNAGAHNSIYRGKYLGSSVTSTQYSAISAGTFTDMFIGDYWTINGVNWRIAGFDYWLNCGDNDTTTHHVVLVPDTALHSAKMNNSNVTTGGYVGSDFYTGANSNTGKSDAITKVNAAFGAAHILSHRKLLTNAVTDGKASGWAWYDSTVELMNEVMVYGTNVWSSSPGYETGVDKSQLPLFRLDHSRICNRGVWWLRSVYSATDVAIVYADGSARAVGASYSLNVRPAFAIKA